MVVGRILDITWQYGTLGARVRPGRSRVKKFGLAGECNSPRARGIALGGGFMGFSTDNADSGQPPNGQRQPRPRELETVHQVIEAYLVQAKRELAPRTYHELTQPILKRFDAAFGHLTVAEARPFDLQEFINNNPTFRSE